MDLTLNNIMEFDGMFLKPDEEESCKPDLETIEPPDVVQVEYATNEEKTDEEVLKVNDAEFPISVDAKEYENGAVDNNTQTSKYSSRRKTKGDEKKSRAAVKKTRKVVSKTVSVSNRVLRSKSPATAADRSKENQYELFSDLENSGNDSEDDFEYEECENASKREMKSKRKSSKPRKLKLRIRRDFKVVKMVDVGVGDDVVDSDLEKARKMAASSDDDLNEASSGEEYDYGGKKNQKKPARLKSKVKLKAELDKEEEYEDDGNQITKKKRGPKPKLGGNRRTRMSACKECGRCFRQVYLKTHMRTHTGEKPYSCEDCGKNFSTDCYLKMHRQSCHQDPQAFQCDICYRNLASKGSLKEHKRTHSDERPFQCHICQKVFRQPALLINHVKTHSTLTPYQCELCGRSYKYKRSMEMHKERIHDGIRKTFPCNICNKVFTRKTKLKDHTNWHFGKSRHLCEHCGKRFLSRKTLRTHLLIHEDKKPYPCEVCGKSFRQAHVLKRHITTHTGIKPFHCDDCGKQFIHRVYLIRHDCPKAGVSGKMTKKEMAPIQNMIMPVYGDALMMGSTMEQYLPDVPLLLK